MWQSNELHISCMAVGLVSASWLMPSELEEEETSGLLLGWPCSFLDFLFLVLAVDVFRESASSEETDHKVSFTWALLTASA